MLINIWIILKYQMPLYKEQREAYKKAIELYNNNLNKKGKKNENKNNDDIKESISSAYASIVSLYITTDLCDDPNAENICENSINEALKYCLDSIEALLQLSNLRIIRNKKER